MAESYAGPAAAMTIRIADDERLPKLSEHLDIRLGQRIRASSGV